MGDIVSLSKTPIDLHSDAGHQFVIDATRAGEGLLTDADLTEKYELTDADWKAIRGDRALGRAVRAERERRMLSGTAARESAARYFVKGPSILDQIATAPDSNDRHKIDALRELRATAAIGGSADRPAGGEMFLIRIDLSADGKGEVIEKTIDIKINEDKPDAEGEW